MTSDAYVRQETLVGRVYVKSGFGLDTYVALNWDPLFGTAVLVGVASDGRMAIGTWMGDEPTDWTLLGDITTTNFVGVGFTVWVYTDASGRYSFTIVTDDGRVSATPLYTTAVTSGKIGVFKRTAGSYLVEMEANFGFSLT